MEAGTTIDERYEVLEKLGIDTYVAVNLSSGVKWILKALLPDVSADTVRMLQMMRYPSLPRVFETLRVDGKTYYVVEYIEGWTLLDLCERRGGRLPCTAACEYMGIIARTLYFLHTQAGTPLLHLDIKPGNIVVSKSNLPCLIDYGSLRAKADRQKVANADPGPRVSGTPGYMPPEVLQGQEPTEQSDIYMAGMTLFRLITGLEPAISLQGDAKKWSPFMPPIVSGIIQKCIMNKQEDRYGNASELASDLETASDRTLVFESSERKDISEQGIVQGQAISNQGTVPGRVSERKVAGLPNLSESKTRGGSRCGFPQNRILCVWNNCQFAAELSGVLAKQGKKVLIVDADLLSPGIDMLVEFKERMEHKEQSLLGNSTLADLMEEFAKNRLNIETIRMTARKTSVENLFCLCGDYRMEDYEYYSTEGLVGILKTASSGYDHVVVSCGKFIYDEFTCVSQICADRILVPILANSMQFREFNRYIHFLSGRKQLEREKVIFVAFDYQCSEDLGYGTCDELCGGSFAGSISYSAKRRMMLGTKKSYLNVMEPKIEKQYLGIIKKSAI